MQFVSPTLASMPYLHRMHTDVYTSIQQCVVNLTGEQALSTNVCERLIENFVASRLDDDDFNGTVFTKLWKIFLRQETTQQRYICTLVGTCERRRAHSNTPSVCHGSYRPVLKPADCHECRFLKFWHRRILCSYAVNVPILSRGMLLELAL